MQKISLDEFCAQWVPQPGRQSLTSRLAYNASEFTTLAGAFSRRFFQMSFAQGGLRKRQPLAAAYLKVGQEVYPPDYD